MKPAYLKISRDKLKKRAEKAWGLLNPCRVCPRKCGVDRKLKIGFCQMGKKPVVSSAHPHFGEERPLVGPSTSSGRAGGSGTVFFSSCNLACAYCQNWEISQGYRLAYFRGELENDPGSGQKLSLEPGSSQESPPDEPGSFPDPGSGARKTIPDRAREYLGGELSDKDLAQMMIRLQNLGCHNINFVSPTIWVPQILKALAIARDLGLKLPLVYNTGGYDSVETLKLLDGIVDIYMPDIKYSDNKMGQKYSLVPNYWDVVQRAIREMFRQVGDLAISDQGLATRGLLIRHLVLPNGIAGTRKVMKFLASLSKDTYVNIMAQYYPANKANQYPEINRRITSEEFEGAVQMAKEAGLHRFD